MKRRDFISLMGGAVVALPSRDRSQASLRIPTVAYLWHAASPKEE